MYHTYASKIPIINYYNHLFKNKTNVWINGDHYKWCNMRTLVINEKFITEEASGKDKFMKWATTVPYARLG